MHFLILRIMGTWNSRRCNPACKVEHMVSVQNQLEYIRIVFQVQFDRDERPITHTSSSDDASSTRHTE